MKVYVLLRAGQAEPIGVFKVKEKIENIQKVLPTDIQEVNLARIGQVGQKIVKQWISQKHGLAIYYTLMEYEVN
jgi:hypothetical protein